MKLPNHVSQAKATIYDPHDRNLPNCHGSQLHENTPAPWFPRISVGTPDRRSTPPPRMASRSHIVHGSASMLESSSARGLGGINGKSDLLRGGRRKSASISRHGAGVMEYGERTFHDWSCECGCCCCYQDYDLESMWDQRLHCCACLGDAR